MPVRLVVLAAALSLAACSGDGGYVGTWRAAGPDSLERRYTFLTDGSARIVEQPPGEEPAVYQATYEVLGDSVLRLRDDLQDARFRVRLEGDTLHLENPASGVRNALVRM